MVEGFPYIATDSSDCNWFYIGLVIVIIYLLFKRTSHHKKHHHQKHHHYEKFSALPGSVEEPSEGRITPPDFDGVCSPQCCLQTQWPVDFMESSNTFDFSAYEPTVMHCRGCEGSGCLCVPKKPSVVAQPQYY